jgi:hypothetical protein
VRRDALRSDQDIRREEAAGGRDAGNTPHSSDQDANVRPRILLQHRIEAQTSSDHRSCSLETLKQESSGNLIGQRRNFDTDPHAVSTYGNPERTE